MSLLEIIVEYKKELISFAHDNWVENIENLSNVLLFFDQQMLQS